MFKITYIGGFGTYPLFLECILYFWNASPILRMYPLLLERMSKFRAITCL